jgi:hypothetical protein
MIRSIENGITGLDFAASLMSVLTEFPTDFWLCGKFLKFLFKVRVGPFL